MTWSESSHVNVDAQHERLDVVVHGSMSAFATQTSPTVARVFNYTWLYCYVTSKQCSDSADLLFARLLSSPTHHGRIGPFLYEGAYAHS